MYFVEKIKNASKTSGFSEQMDLELVPRTLWYAHGSHARWGALQYDDLLQASC